MRGWEGSCAAASPAAASEIPSSSSEGRAGSALRVVSERRHVRETRDASAARVVRPWRATPPPFGLGESPDGSALTSTASALRVLLTAPRAQGGVVRREWQDEAPRG
jgi:hypothetical protein